jgi:hypothetical protein
MKKFIYLCLLFTPFLSCDEESLQGENFVVEAYLYAGEKVDGIKIKQVEDIYTVETKNIILTNAQITLKKNNISYPLIFDNNKQSYMYSGSDLKVEVNDIFELEVRVGDRISTAKTIVPKATAGISISGNKIVIPPIAIRLGIVEELTKLFSNARVTTRWNNPDDQLHFIVIENIQAGDLIFPSDFPIPEATLKLIQSFRYISAPTKNTNFEIPGLSLETYGRYRAKVYRVNQEYSNLYNNQIQDSRDLNAPPSNINNALGIFSAFASDSVFFEVVKQ